MKVKFNQFLKSGLIILLFVFSFSDASAQITGTFQPVGNEGFVVPEKLAINSQGELFTGGCEKIYKWNGSKWETVHEDFNGPVEVLAFDSQDKLYVGGDFDKIGGASINHVAMWDGTSWSGLGSGLALEPKFMDFDDQDNLYTATDWELVVRKWDGAVWDTVGGSIGINVTALLVEPQGGVYTGNWDLQGAGSTHILNHWNGTQWDTIIDASYSDRVVTIARDQQGNIYAGGDFETIDGQTVNNIVKWDGTSLSSLGAGNNGGIRAIAIDAQDHLYVGGGFEMIGGAAARNIAYWDGIGWSSLGGIADNGTEGGISSLHFNSDGDLYVLGRFDSLGTVLSPSIGIWKNNSWNGLGQLVVNRPAVSMTTDTQGNLYVGGYFSYLFGTLSNGLAKWDGSVWTDAGAGLVIPSGTTALATDNQGNLYSGGPINPEDYEYSHINKWDGSTWTNLADSVEEYEFVRDLAADNDGNLYAIVAGDYDEAGIVRKWDGSTWTILDSSVFTADAYYFYDIHVSQSGELWGAVEIENQGSSALHGVVKWDGNAWNLVGEFASSFIVSLDIDAQGTPYIGGYFTSIGANNINRVAKWNGTAWEALGNGIDGYVGKVVLDENGWFYVAGDEVAVTGEDPSGFVVWDGTSWQSPTPGFNESCDWERMNIAAKPGGGVYISGSFDAPYPLITAWSSDSLSTSISETISDLSISLFPNPSSGMLSIKSSETPIESIALYDLSGKRLPVEVTINRDEAILHTDYQGLTVAKIYTQKGMMIRKILFQ